MTPEMLSPLGRKVDNWWDYDKDSILSALYSAAHELFGSGTPISARLLAEKISLDGERIIEIGATLAQEGLVDQDEVSRGFYKLTPKGKQEVSRSKERI
jgi:Mn-dependent DtxR family transcriptional regulator